MNLDAVLNWRFEPYEISLNAERAILYALSIGIGRDPLDPDELPFVYEQSLRVMPTLAMAVALKGFWAQDPATELDWRRMLLAEQAAIFHRPFPAEGWLVSTSRIDGVLDKGADKGALIYLETELHDRATGELVVTLDRTIMARGDGGCGGVAGRARPMHPTPERSPDASRDFPTAPNQALLYRLNGDLNPLHADPEVAAAAGFARPIFHGLGTFGVAAHALLKEACGHDPARMRAIRARFASPVFPGETLRTELWHEDDGVLFRVRAVERDVVALSGGRLDLSRGEALSRRPSGPESRR